MPLKSIRRYTFEHKPLHFGESSESNFEYLSIESQYDDKGNLLEEIKYTPDGKPEEINRFTYNTDGKLTSHEMEMAQEGMKDVIRYERNPAGHLLKEQKFYGEDPGEASAYTYNNDGAVTEVVKTDADGEFESRDVFMYDEKGNIREKLSKDEKGNTIGKSIMEYDDSGNLAHKKDLDGDGNLSHSTNYTYNEKNSIESVVQRTATEKLTESVRYRYDERGNIIEKAIRDFHPRTFKFTFNEKDECVEEMVYDQNGQLNTKSVFEYNKDGRVTQELTYHMDVNRNDLNKGHRFEYEFYA